MDKRGVSPLIATILLIAITLAVAAVMIFTIASSPRPGPPYAGVFGLLGVDTNNPYEDCGWENQLDDRVKRTQPLAGDIAFAVGMSGMTAVDEAFVVEGVRCGYFLGLKVTPRNLGIRINAVEITGIIVTMVSRGRLVDKAGTYDIEPGDYFVVYMWDAMPTWFKTTLETWHPAAAALFKDHPRLTEGDVISLHYLPLNQTLLFYRVTEGPAA